MRTKLRLLLIAFAVIAGVVTQFFDSEEDESGGAPNQRAETTLEKAETPEIPPPTFEFEKIHPFQDLKEAYQVHWKGEENGNPFFDGKRTTITGKVSGIGALSRMQEDGTSVAVYSSLQFRGPKFDGRDFGYGLECRFKPEEKDVLEGKAPKGTLVRVSGKILMQEIYIEPGFTYRKLSLGDCELLSVK